jgi:hypothetical protein
MESSMEVPQITENSPTIQSSDTVGHILEGMKTEYSRPTCTSMFITALFKIAKL